MAGTFLSGRGNATPSHDRATAERLHALEHKLDRAYGQIESLWSEREAALAEAALAAQRHKAVLDCLAAFRIHVKAAATAPPGRRLKPTLAAITADTAAFSRMLAPPLDRLEISSPFGPRNGRFHHGVDFRVPAKTPVRASDGGRVTHAGWLGDLGLTVEIDHGGGDLTRYAHLSKSDVVVGNTVGRGQVLGRVGRTGRAFGDHLHFEVEHRGRTVDPAPILGQSARYAETCIDAAL